MDELSQYKLLSKHKRNSSFEVPDAYFDELPAVIQARCANEKKSLLSKITNADGIYKYAFGIGLVVVASVYYFSSLSSNADQINSGDLISYVEHKEIENMDVDMLEEELNEEVLSTETSQNKEIEEIEDYLMNENLSESELVNEL